MILTQIWTNGGEQFLQSPLPAPKSPAHSKSSRSSSSAPKEREGGGTGGAIKPHPSSHGASSADKMIMKTRRIHQEEFPEPSLFLAVAGYVSYCFLIVVGYIREFIWGIGPVEHVTRTQRERDRNQYTPLYASFESFYTRNVYRRLKDTFGIPICSVPGAEVELMNRSSPDHFWTMKLEPTSRKRCVNMASYNYLGFAENSGLCTEAAIREIRQGGLNGASPAADFGGRTQIHGQLERELATFLNVEAAMTFGMGFATNSLNLPALLGKGCLVLSDEKNHASLILGLRLSRATVKVFKHNNVDNLEKILRKSIICGHPRTRRPFKKILIVVEGVYSMEGSIVKLPEIVALKQKYGAYLYLDEAHSIGALGAHGRGVVDYYNLNHRDIDILMGTFSKSFGGNGGYIAGSQRLVKHLRARSANSKYCMPLSPPVAAQVLTAMRQIVNPEVGQRRMANLRENTLYFRTELKKSGFTVYGHQDSPVVPLMIFLPAKLRAVVNGLLAEGVATVGVGFPATPITEERVRFCISSGHTREMLDQTILAMRKLGKELRLTHKIRTT